MNLKDTLLSYKVVVFASPVAEKNNAMQEVRNIAESMNCPVIPWDILSSLNDSGVQVPKLLNTINGNFSKQPQGVWVIENLFSLLNKVDKIDKELISAAIEKYYLDVRNKEHNYIVFLETKYFEIPQEFSAAIPTYVTPFPNSRDIENLLIAAGLPPEMQYVNLLSGLTREEIKLGIKIASNAESIEKSLASYKKRQLESVGLSFLGEPSVEDFGGFDNLKEYLENLRHELSPEAREYGLPRPKGMMFIGPPGVGKTHTAKIISKRLGLPLINVSIDSIKGKGLAYFGQVLRRLEACAPAIAYFDELDKMFPDIKDSTDAGVLGLYLTWLQENEADVYVIATLNRINNLPPEVTRIGRFDEIFYVGFPSAAERHKIIKLYAKKFDPRYGAPDLPEYGGVLTMEEWQELLELTENMSGAELAKIVQMVASVNFRNKKQSIDYQGFIEVLKNFVSLYMRSPNTVLDIINKSKDIAKNASRKDTSPFAVEKPSLYVAS